MKNLTLIRHAKSSWDVPLRDKDRHISNRGIKDAHLVSSNILKYLPEKFVILSSNAKRAIETATIFSQNWSCTFEGIIFMDDLYTFDENQLERTIKSFNNDYENVIVFGHNVAITNFVNKFGDILIENVPTSGLVSINFDCENWNLLNKGKTKKTIFPRDLKL
ncbi:MAG: histidine phosphatase family protein [Flavobacteriaceae bacterium]|nr:histidine phosphatase family protein [Flavobacteriaceae bacterium]